MTPRWKARFVTKRSVDGRVFNYETEDGRKFKYWSSSTMSFNKDTKFYIVKHSGEHNSVEFKFWVYPIPFKTATYCPFFRSYRDYPRYFSGPRNVVVEIK